MYILKESFKNDPEWPHLYLLLKYKNISYVCDLIIEYF